MPRGVKGSAGTIWVENSGIEADAEDPLGRVTGDDTAIACCVSAMAVGKQMQFFGARVNLAKTLLYAINGGRAEVSGVQVAHPGPVVTGDYRDYDHVRQNVDAPMD